MSLFSSPPLPLALSCRRSWYQNAVQYGVIFDHQTILEHKNAFGVPRNVRLMRQRGLLCR